MINATQHPLTLISHRLCPYVQRAVIALEELDIDYQRVDIDLDNPPDWFLKLSPLGKVPVLVVDNETVLFESAVIAEYINERGAGELLATDSLQRARQRAWIEFASATLDNIGALYSASESKSFERVAGQLDAKWQQLEDVLPADGYFAGADITLIDAEFAPVVRYIDLFELLVERDFELPQQGEIWQRYRKWHQTMLAQSAFQATAFDQENYQQRLIDHYYPYSLGEDQKDVAG
jgi:glutathione S-transferase